MRVCFRNIGLLSCLRLIACVFAICLIPRIVFSETHPVASVANLPTALAARESLSEKFDETARGVPKSDLAGMSFKLLDGRTLHAEEIRSRRVILFFWSVYCTNCLSDIDSLTAIKSRFAGDDVSFYAVHLFESRVEKIREVMAKRGIRLPVVIASDDIRSRLAVRVLPSYLVFDEDKQLLGRFEGPKDSAALEMLLGEPIPEVKQEALLR